MTSRSDVWPSASVTQTSNSQYGQWYGGQCFDATRRTTSPSVARYVNVMSCRHQHPASAISRSHHSHTSRDQLTSRDQVAVTSSCDESSDSRDVSWRPLTLPLSLQRSSTTLGVAGRLSTSGAGMDSPSSQSHADLIRDYQRYRQIQAGISGDERGTSRLLTRPTTSVSATPGQTVSISTTSSVDTVHHQQQQQQQQQHQQPDTETTTVVPLQLAIAGPKPLQQSVQANVISSRRLPADFSVRRAYTGYAAGRPPSSSLLTSLPSHASQVTRQLNSAVQVYFHTLIHNPNSRKRLRNTPTAWFYLR